MYFILETMFFSKNIKAKQQHTIGHSDCIIFLDFWKTKKKKLNLYLSVKMKSSSLHCKPIPVMKTGFSLCTFPNREKPVFISCDPCNENRLFPVGKNYTGKSLFWPCTDPVRDCSEYVNVSFWLFHKVIMGLWLGIRK